MFPKSLCLYPRGMKFKGGFPEDQVIGPLDMTKKEKLFLF